MERIVYNRTLDVHKNGTQFTLQGFETADKLARRIVISLMASGDAIDFPLEKIMAVMYVNTPKATEPSIIECEIKDNTIIYDVLPIVEEGITEMQLKLIETSPEGATSVLAVPKFAVEVTKSNMDEGSVTQTQSFSALEEAVAKAKGVYDERFLRLELSSDCMFRAYYADGTVYESDVLKELFHKGDALLSQSYARGDSGVRTGEETDNSMYYSNVAKSASIEAQAIKGDASAILDEVKLHGVYTAFSVDFETGEVEYVSPRYSFKVNPESGELDVIGEAYTFEGDIERIVEEWLLAREFDIGSLVSASAEHTKDIAYLQTSIVTHGETISELQRNTTKKASTITYLMDYNTSVMSCMRDAAGKLITEKEEVTKLCSVPEYAAAETGIKVASTLFDYQLTLAGFQPDCKVEIYGSLNTAITRLNWIKCCLYDASNGELLGESNPWELSNTSVYRHIATIELTEEVQDYIIRQSPSVRLDIVANKTITKDHYEGNVTIGLLYEKAKHYTYAMPE